MGPGWFLSAEQFWRQGGCDEAHGGWGQQGVEVALKAWLSGNALMVNKRTWFSHWFRGGGGPGFPYPISGREVDTARQYSRDLWLNNKWPLATRKLAWLVEKFNPLGWENTVVDQDRLDDIHRLFYKQLHPHAPQAPRWRGIKILKFSTDLLLYHQMIWENKPQWIVETGTLYGGSSLFFQDQLDLVGLGGRVITIDKYPREDLQRDPRVTYLAGGSTSMEILNQVHALVDTSGSVMVVLDSDHSRQHVKREVVRYSPIVTKGQYMVVEDCYEGDAKLHGAGEAVDWFLSRTKTFQRENPEKQFQLSLTRDGWLRRK
jgi:cephalosporin hydroxylase